MSKCLTLHHQEMLCMHSCSVLDYSKADYVEMNNFLLGYDFSDIFKHSKSNHPRWFTSDIRHQLNCIRTLKRRCRTTDSPALSDRLATMEVHLQKTFLLLNLILKPNWCMTFPTQSLRKFLATSSLFPSKTLFHLLCLWNIWWFLLIREKLRFSISFSFPSTLKVS